MDNLSVHKGSRIQELISSTGAKLIFLPAYSPDLSPIELCWSKFKEFLRSRQALSSRAIRSRYSAKRTLLLTEDDVIDWFEPQWFIHMKTAVKGEAHTHNFSLRKVFLLNSSI
ncbi:MAG: hypothetical protein F6K23_12760 [Okeania sp. SIO2C9]|uniref:transposase n=1 Tax=Okeania sp. SIO2C9 TaxID=2607791 RepID=UPI0013C0CD48|nr:hypothetical protein [Okeania sp. SIO2C9]